MKMTAYLPIGSIILLKRATKKLMIIGIKQRIPGEEGKEYDYIGVLYPEGYLTKELIYMFNHEDINDVIFTGYHNPERGQFLEKAEAYLKTKEEQESGGDEG